ncbi:MAG: RNA-guided pseudouridylation complex pseudouridine synthase subunit Cbf5 [Candidatus Heimdallarchaeota archaeon]|nr:RNA-guided pseudouridylation complex pseudouridine synthase subunit Cbf5 [Candidatus Heimdallarchaeota archaeon]
MVVKGRLPSEIEHKWVVKSDDVEITEYGRKPEERPIMDLIQFGIINVDKQPNPTSQEIVATIKEIFDLPKAGHSGTLDPAVSGILPVALGSATKILPTLLLAGKEYICVMQLHDEVARDKLEAVFYEFTGEIYQKPPVKSSVKRVLRSRRIYYLDLLEVEERAVLFKVGSEAGTYIRKLCHDMGLVLGCGAHMKELRRTKVGPFKEDETLASLYRIFDAYEIWKESGEEKELREIVLPMEEGMSHLPQIVVRDNAIGAICHGANLAAPGVVKLHQDIKRGSVVLLKSLKGEGVALAKAKKNADEILESNHGIIANTQRVLMPRETYPKLWKENNNG